MARGKLVRIMRDQEFGFIAVEGGSGEVFVHFSALPRGVIETLESGREFEFDIENDPQGGRKLAVNVRLVD